MSTYTTRKINLLYQVDILFVFVLSTFLLSGFYFAFKVLPGIMPDEEGHLLFSNVYSTTFLIPQDTPETMISGWAITFNPFLYYWINGRVINLVNLFTPGANAETIRIILRLLNLFYASTTLWISLLISKELFPQSHWQLLPTVLLSQVLMFSFLSGGVSYDNMANLFAFASLLFFIRTVTRKDLNRNFVLMIIFLGLGTLAKVTLVPLAGLIMIAVLVQWIKTKQPIIGKLSWTPAFTFLSVFAITIMASSAYLYIGNLIRFNSLTPECSEIFSQNYCSSTPFAERSRQIQLEDPLTFIQSIKRGYPDPLKYFLISWIPNMIHRIHGILAHQSYFPHLAVKFLYALMVWYLFLVAFQRLRLTALDASLLFIFSVYTLLLFCTNYKNELAYGFRQIGMHGRYLFPVIIIAYTMMTKVLIETKSLLVKYGTLAVTLVVFIASGPLFFFINRNALFGTWLIH